MKKPIWFSRVWFAALSAVGLFGSQSVASAATPINKATVEEQLKVRVERARERLLSQPGVEEVSSEKARKIAQWYNWPNWGNWFNGWRNW